MFLDLVISGLSSGSIYAIVAMGMVIVYKATTVVNFAHGETFMLGSFLAYMFLVSFGMPYLVSINLAVAITMLVGIITERIAYRPLIRASIISMVLCTVGFSIVLKGLARFIWGGKGEFIPFPPVFEIEPIRLWRLSISPQHILILLGAISFMLMFGIFFRVTKLGKMMRATAENKRAASLVGIRIEKVFSIIWGVGALAGATAGVLSAPVTLLYPDMGTYVLIKAFAASVLGGMDSILGAILGGFCMGVIENLAGGYISTALVDISPFIIIIVILILRPTGFLGSKEITKV